MNHGVMLLESTNGYSSFMELISGDKISYIGYYYKNDEDSVIIRFFETSTGKAPSFFSQLISMEKLLSMTTIKKITYHEIIIDSYAFKEAIEEFERDISLLNINGTNETLENIYKKFISYYVLGDKSYSQIIDTGYYYINSILARIMNIKFNDRLQIMDNNILGEANIIINEDFDIESNINTNINQRLNIVMNVFKNLYTYDHAFRKALLDKKKNKILYNYSQLINDKKLEEYMSSFRNEIRSITNDMHKDKMIHIDINKIVDCYNNLVNHLHVGYRIPDDGIPTSHGAIVTSRGCLNVNTETITNNDVKIMKSNEGTIKINSKIDGEIIIPLFNADLRELCTEDLYNIRDMINSFNVNDTRFFNIENHITDLLSERNRGK